MGERGENQPKPKDIFCLYPLALSRIAVFDMRIPTNHKVQPMLLDKKSVFPRSLQTEIESHFIASNESPSDNILNEILANILAHVDYKQEIWFIPNKSAEIWFIKGSIREVVELNEVLRADPIRTGRVFSNLLLEEQRHYLRNLVEGNPLAGFATLWEKPR